MSTRWCAPEALRRKASGALLFARRADFGEASLPEGYQRDTLETRNPLGCKALRAGSNFHVRGDNAALSWNYFDLFLIVFF